MSLKAKLVVRLYANDMSVAESSDEILWQEILSRITSVARGAPPTQTGGDFFTSFMTPASSDPTGNSGALKAFAKEIGISNEALVAACSPTFESPYIALDRHNWSAFKKNTPPRGAYAVSGAQLAGTIADLWFRHAKLGHPNQAQLHAILNTIGATDKNASRALKNCRWLQSRGRDGIHVNPAEVTKALDIVRAYCLKEPIRGSGQSDD